MSVHPVLLLPLVSTIRGVCNKQKNLSWEKHFSSQFYKSNGHDLAEKIGFYTFEVATKLRNLPGKQNYLFFLHLTDFTGHFV